MAPIREFAQQIRAGVEWVLIWGRVKLPLRAGYFNDRQITPNPGGVGPMTIAMLMQNTVRAAETAT